MILHTDISDKNGGNSRLMRLIRSRAILFAGNRALKIYGTLSCTSGKRMKTGNRVFFENENEARVNGYRPCGHCMKALYKEWKQQHMLPESREVRKTVRK